MSLKNFQKNFFYQVLHFEYEKVASFSKKIGSNPIQIDCNPHVYECDIKYQR